MTEASMIDVHDDLAMVTERPLKTLFFIYAGLVMLVVILLHSTVFEMISKWATSSTYIYGFAVLPISILMIRNKLQQHPVGGSIIPGIAVMTWGALLWIVGSAAAVSLIEQIAFVSLLIGSAGIVFGAKALRVWAFPLLFLYFMVPFGEVLIPGLQRVTAQFAISSLSLVGANVSLEGSFIYTPAGIFEVARACAGLKFLMSAVMLAAAFSYLNYRSWSKRITFIAFAATIAIIANGIRVFLIVLVATLTEKKYGVGFDHVLVGWMFYALVFFILVSVGNKYADQQNKMGRTLPVKHMMPEMSYRRVIPSLMILAIAMGYNSLIVEREVDRVLPASLTLLNAPGWRILPPPENWRAPLSGADRTVAATYTKPDSTVYFSTGYFTHDRQGAEIATSSNRAWDGEYWRKIGQTEENINLFGKSEIANFSIMAGPERRRLAVVTAYWLDDTLYLKSWRMKLAQMKSKIRGRNSAGGILLLAAAYKQHPSEAISTIREFTTDVEPLDSWLSRNRAQ